MIRFRIFLERGYSRFFFAANNPGLHIKEYSPGIETAINNVLCYFIAGSQATLIRESTLDSNERIFLCQDIDDLLEIMGEPISVRENHNSKDDRWNIIECDFEGFSIKYYEGWKEINQIIIKTNEYSTLRNLTVGDSIDKIFSEYNIHDFHNKPDYIYGNLTVEDDLGIPSTFVIRFFITNNIITGIEMQIEAEL